MQWHTLGPDAPLENPDTFETAALSKTHLALSTVPPRYRSSYFMHICGYEKPELIEEYTYLNLKINNGFTDADFDTKNPNYSFR